MFATFLDDCVATPDAALDERRCTNVVRRGPFEILTTRKLEYAIEIPAGATILGGDTVIGKGSVVGGNTWVVHSIPPRSRVVTSPQEQKIERKRRRRVSR